MPRLSVVIPAYNEEKRLGATLESLREYFSATDEDVEVIVVDDGSKDRTVEVAELFGGDVLHLRVLRFLKNQGKGHAVKQGMLAAKGEYALFIDADNSTPIAEIAKLWPFADEYEVVIGSRHLHGSNVVIKQPWYRIIMSRMGNLLIRATIVRGIRDTQCGFKLFQREACKAIFSRQQTMGFGFDMEILAIAQKILHYNIKEVPVSWYNSPDSRVRPIHDAWRTLKELFRIKYGLLAGKYRNAK